MSITLATTRKVPAGHQRVWIDDGQEGGWFETMTDRDAEAYREEEDRKNREYNAWCEEEARAEEARLDLLFCGCADR